MSNESVQLHEVVRNEPVQERAAARVETLLDAAASVLVEGGLEVLTTQQLAERAGASIGTVYRYFPDRTAVLRALGFRNRIRLDERVAAALGREHATWLDAFLAVFDVTVEMYRHEPAFRVIRTGDFVAFGSQHQPERYNNGLVGQLLAHFQQRYDVEFDDEQAAAISRTVLIADALLIMAFQYEADGDADTIEMAHRLALDELLRSVPDPRV